MNGRKIVLLTAAAVAVYLAIRATAQPTAQPAVYAVWDGLRGPTDAAGRVWA